MAILTETQKQDILNEKDKTVKEGLKQERLAAQKKMKQEAAAIQEEKKKIKQEEKTKNARGEKYWDLVKENANRMITKEFTGFNDWAIAMQGVLTSCMELEHAMRVDPIKFTNFIPYRDEIGQVLIQAKDTAWDRTIGVEMDRYDLKRMKNEELPKLRFTVSLDENGKYHSEITKNGETAQDLKTQFDNGFTGWAQYNGYEMHNENGEPVFKDEQGNKLTKEAFEELDKRCSLAEFMSGRFDMSIGCSTSFSP